MTRSVLVPLVAALAVWHIAAPGSSLGSPRQPRGRLVEREAYVMGTRVTLLAHSHDREAGLARLDAALVALEETEQELSTWRPDSQISRFNRTPVGARWHASPSLCVLFSELFSWQKETVGTFDPAIGALADAWQIHRSGRLPSATELAAALAHSGTHLIRFERPSCDLTRLDEVTVDVGAFGKGAALDRAATVLGEEPWMIDFGGQVSAGGTLPHWSEWSAALADPSDRQRPVAHLRLPSGSLSTSGGSEHDMQVGRSRVGHILDPRTGRPSPFNGSVAVRHARGLAADVLSTALYVMGPAEGLRWAAAHELEVAFLLPESGRVRIVGTPNFVRRVTPLSNTALESFPTAPKGPRLSEPE